MKKYLAFVFLLAIAMQLPAQSEIFGTWSGKIHFSSSVYLTFVVHINGTTADSITADSPDQSTYGLRPSSATITKDSIQIVFDKLAAQIIGSTKLENDSLNCIFSQRGTNFDVRLGRGYTRPARMQDPKDFPYVVEDVEIYNPDTDVKLAGTITIPYDNKFEKIAILVSGSGQQNRDEELFGHRPFLVLSDYLTRNGIAVLRYDDRGYAESTGNYINATSYDFSIDAESVVTFLRNDSRFKDKKIGIIGHSEGGMIAPMVAARNNNVDFIVMLAGPGIPIQKLMERQVYDVLKSSGADEESIKTQTKEAADMYKVITNSKLSLEAKQQKLFEIQKTSISRIPSNKLEGDIDEIAETNAKQLLIPWMYYFINSNPQEYLSKVKVPVLALNGDKDVQVYSKDNLAGIEKSLKKAKNHNYTTMELKGLNHLFQSCIFGGSAMYQKNKETFNENAMSIIASWINKL